MGPYLWLILLLALAILFAGMEVIVPSGGILAVLALLAVAGSVYFAFQIGTVFGIIYFVLIVIFGTLAVRWMIKWFPKSKVGKMFILDPEDDPALAPDEELEKLKELLNKPGIVRSRMMPSGIVEIDARKYDAFSEGEPLDPGEEVVVVDVQGILITVRKLRGPIDLQKPIAEASPEEVPPDIEDPFA